MTFWGLLDDAARRVPDAVVLADDHGRSLTTTALRDAAGRAAAGLHGHGSGPRAGCPVDVGVQYL